MAKTPEALPGNIFMRGTTCWGRIRVAGRELRFSLRTGDVDLAKRRVEERRLREIAETVFEEKRHTWPEAVLAWSQHASGNVSAGTSKRYGTSLTAVAGSLNGLFLDQITNAALHKMIRDRKEAGAGNATIRRDLTAISLVLNYAIAHGWRETNPALDVRRTLRERRDPIVLPELADIEFVAAGSPGNLGPLIRFALATGCRQNEIAIAEHGHIDRQRGQMAIYKTKRGRPRVIDLSPAVLTLIAGVPQWPGSQWLFHHSGQPYRTVSSQWRGLMQRAQKRAQKAGRVLPWIRFHDLRHRHAVDFLKAGGGIYDLSHRLGHTSVKTTEIYLAHLTPDEARRSR